MSSLQFWPVVVVFGVGAKGSAATCCPIAEAPDVILAIRLTPSRSASRDASGDVLAGIDSAYAAAATNSVPSTQMRCKMIPIFRATATRALL